MAHPHRLVGREIAEERRLLGLELGLAVLGDVVRLDLAAQVTGHQLHPVTDAEGGDAELEDPRIDVRRTVHVDRCGAAGEDQGERIPPAHLLGADAVTDELRVDPGLADAAGDQLRVLATEVDDEDRPLLRRGLGRRERDDLGRLSHDGSSARPS